MSVDLIENCVVFAEKDNPNPGDLKVYLLGANAQPISQQNSARVAFKSGLHTDVGYDIVTITDPLNIVIPSTSPVGFHNGLMARIYIYLARIPTAIQLTAVGRIPLEEQLAGVTEITNNSYHQAVMYGNQQMSNADIRCVGSIMLQYNNGWVNDPVDFAVGSWWRMGRPARGCDITDHPDDRLYVTTQSLKDVGATGTGTQVTVVNGVVTAIS